MNCDACGHEVPSGATFCIYCGTRIMKRCPQCAEQVKVQASLCKHCGHQFEEADQPHQESSVVRQRQSRRHQENREYRNSKQYREKNPPRMISRWGEKVFECPNCLNLNALGDSSSCIHCGTSLTETDVIHNPFL